MNVAIAATPTARPRLGKWGALGLLMVLAFLNYMDRNMVYPLLPLIAKSLHMTTGQLGALSTGFHVVYATTAPVCGMLSDRVARKAVLLVALVAWSCITMLSGTATGFAALLVWRSLTGLGEGGYFPTAVSVIGDLFEPNRRGLALALHGVCTTLGGSAGYAFGGVVGDRFGWRVPFFVALVPGLVLAFVVWRFFDEPPRGGAVVVAPAAASAGPPREEHPYRAGGGDVPAAARRPYLTIVTSAPVLMVSFAACAGALAMTGINTFLPLYLVRARGVGVGDAGIFTGAAFTMALVGQLLGGVLSDAFVGRFAGARPALLGGAYLLAAPIFVAVAHVPGLGLAVAAYAVTQLMRGFAEPNIYGTVIDATPSLERGSAQGFLLMLTFVGSSAAGLLGGLSIEHFGFDATFAVFAAASAVCGVLGVGLFSYIRARVDRSRLIGPALD